MSDRLLQSVSLTLECICNVIRGAAERTVAEGILKMKISGSNVLNFAAFAVVATIVVKQTWAAIPLWLKTGKVNYDDDDESREVNDDFSSPQIIIKKLTSLRNLTDVMVEESFELPWFKLYASFLAYVHLKEELEALHPEHRNSRYKAEGSIPDVAELQELEQYCQFARWAYLQSYLELLAQLKTRGYELIRRDTSTEPGRVGHFIAVNHESKNVIISIKGTNTLADVVTDMLGVVVQLDLKVNYNDELTIQARVHEGMATAANLICTDTQHLVEKFFLPCGYKIIVTGHSLGAGVACLLGLFLQSRLKGTTHENCRVLAFATPACLDYQTAVAIAPFTTSVVNNNDCVPRLSTMNVVALNKLLFKVNEKLVEKGRSPSGWSSSKAFLSDLMKMDDELLMTPEELEGFEQELKASRPEAHDQALTVPGRVVVLWKSENPETLNQVNARVGDGTLAVLQQIEVETSLISDHMCPEYIANLTALVDKTKNGDSRKANKA